MVLRLCKILEGDEGGGKAFAQKEHFSVGLWFMYVCHSVMVV